MPIYRVNTISQTPDIVGGEKAFLEKLVSSNAPVFIMIHGYKFLPGDPVHCPHKHILGLSNRNDCWKGLSWPLALGIEEGDQGPIGIAFGWQARGTIASAFARAGDAARALAQLIKMIRSVKPDCHIGLIGHSLGARVATKALQDLTAGDVQRLILLNPAEFAGSLRNNLDSPAGRAAQAIHVTSFENVVFDALLSRFVTPDIAADRAIGTDLSELPNALTLRIDRQHVLNGLKKIGFTIAPNQRLVCHWSSYLRDGVFDLYRDFLGAPSRLSIALLRQHTVQHRRPLVLNGAGFGQVV